MLAGDRSRPDFFASVRDPTGSPVATYSVTQWYSTCRARALGSDIGQYKLNIAEAGCRRLCGGIDRAARLVAMSGPFARLGGRATACAFALAIAAGASHARAGFGAPPTTSPDEGPAQRYGRLGREACEAELRGRGISFARVDEARGVLAPVRLTGPLRGVSFHSNVPPAARASSPWEIVDCRLALALDDFALQLGAHDVVDVTHFSIYRPPSVRWPADRIASRHPGALAIDAASFTKKDGSKLDVERDFHGRIGASTCGAGADPNPATAEADELRQIVCEAADARLFNVALTPDYNWAHRNHFHLELSAGSKWFMVH
jgi:hypothetical protein